MRILRIKNILILGTGGISFLLAVVLLGAGQLSFSGIFLGVAVLLLYIGLKSWRKSAESMKGGSS